MSKRNRISKAIQTATYEKMAESGFAAGSGNRARTIPTKIEKMNDPKRQRREKRWMKEME